MGLPGGRFRAGDGAFRMFRPICGALACVTRERVKIGCAQARARGGTCGTCGTSAKRAAYPCSVLPLDFVTIGTCGGRLVGFANGVIAMAPMSNARARSVPALPNILGGGYARGCSGRPSGAGGASAYRGWRRGSAPIATASRAGSTRRRAGRGIVENQGLSSGVVASVARQAVAWTVEMADFSHFSGHVRLMGHLTDALGGAATGWPGGPTAGGAATPQPPAAICATRVAFGRARLWRIATLDPRDSLVEVMGWGWKPSHQFPGSGVRGIGGSTRTSRASEAAESGKVLSGRGAIAGFRSRGVELPTITPGGVDVKRAL